MDNDAADASELEAIERTAVELATIAGAEISRAQERLLEVRYKTNFGAEQIPSDPVSEVDRSVERMIRLALAERHPGHGIIGEEMAATPSSGSAYTWAVDPIDGTANFISGLPLFAASIGVLHHGVPVVGALWCGTSHALRAGIYHGRQGGKLMFGGETLERPWNPAVQRRLAGVPRPMGRVGPWETRKTGSAATECAFVAAGLLEAARFEAPHIWDVAGGLALVRLTGGLVLSREGSRWQLFEGFGDDDRMQSWRQPLILGRADRATLETHLGEI